MRISRLALSRGYTLLDAKKTQDAINQIVERARADIKQIEEMNKSNVEVFGPTIVKLEYCKDYLSYVRRFVGNGYCVDKKMPTWCYPFLEEEAHKALKKNECASIPDLRRIKTAIAFFEFFGRDKGPEKELQKKD